MKNPKSIISDFLKLADKLQMEEIHAQVTCWKSANESVDGESKTNPV